MTYQESLKRVVKGVASITFSAGYPIPALLIDLLSAVLDSEEATRSHLDALQVQLEILLSADARTGSELLARALETATLEREPSHVLEDLHAAKASYTRAISLSRNRMEEAILRHRIAICAIAVDDGVLARRELSHSRVAARDWVNTLAVPVDIQRNRDRLVHNLRRWSSPKTFGDYVYRLMVPDTLSGIGNLRMMAGSAAKDLEKAQAEVDRKKAEASVFVKHLDEVLDAVP